MLMMVFGMPEAKKKPKCKKYEIKKAFKKTDT